MKVYSISKWAFRGICVLILILPVSRHWRLFITGAKAPGTVTRMVIHAEESLVGEKEMVYVSEIGFEVDGATHKAYGPANYEYTPGRHITVFYDRNDPAHNCIATFSGFYLNNYTVLPVILLVVWAAFYMSFNNYRKKMKRVKRTNSFLFYFKRDMYIK